MFWTVNRIGHKAASTRTKYKILSDQKGFLQRIQKHKVDLGHKAFDRCRFFYVRNYCSKIPIKVIWQWNFSPKNLKKELLIYGIYRSLSKADSAQSLQLNDIIISGYYLIFGLFFSPCQTKAT